MSSIEKAVQEALDALETLREELRPHNASVSIYSYQELFALAREIIQVLRIEREKCSPQTQTKIENEPE